MSVMSFPKHFKYAGFDCHVVFKEIDSTCGAMLDMEALDKNIGNILVSSSKIQSKLDIKPKIEHEKVHLTYNRKAHDWYAAIQGRKAFVEMKLIEEYHAYRVERYWVKKLAKNHTVNLYIYTQMLKQNTTDKLWNWVQTIPVFNKGYKKVFEEGYDAAMVKYKRGDVIYVPPMVYGRLVKAYPDFCKDRLIDEDKGFRILRCD